VEEGDGGFLAAELDVIGFTADGVFFAYFYLLFVDGCFHGGLVEQEFFLPGEVGAVCEILWAVVVVLPCFVTPVDDHYYAGY
jgi:hypothetical protein